MKPPPVSFYSFRNKVDELSLDPATRLGLRLAFLTLGLQLIVIAVFWQQLPPEIPLLYSRAYGEDQLVAAGWLWLVPALTFGLESTTIALAAKAKNHYQLWAQLTAWAGTIAALMGLITVVKIISLMV